jgi:hypothetical protein
MRNTTLLLAATLVVAAQAQVSYTFDQDTEPYVPLTGATVCTFDANGFDPVNELDGEAIPLFDQPYPSGSPYSVIIGDWGYLRFEKTGSAVIIDGLFTELEAVDATSTVEYTITGAPGSRVLTAQWTNWHLAQGPVGNYASWQISVEQASGIVRVHTGPNSGGGMIFNDATGPNCGMFQANNAFTTCYERIWVEQDPYDPTLDTLPTFDFDALHAFPPAGTVYSFTPTSTGIAQLPAEGTVNAFVATDGLHVLAPAERTGSALELLDVGGRVLLRAQVTGQETVLPLTGIAPGVHLLHVAGEERTLRVMVP